MEMRQPPAAGGGKKSGLAASKIFGSISMIRELGVFMGLVALFIVFSLTTPVFFTYDNLMNVLRQVSILGIISIGMSMVIGSGEFDLSVGSVYGMVAMFAGHMMTTMRLPIWFSVVAALLIGTFFGGVNGILSTYVKVPSLIVTLGTLNAARGFALLITGGLVITLSPRSVADPHLPAFVFLGRGKLFGSVPTLTIAFVAIALIGYIVYHKNIVGFRMKAVGGNPDAARVSGVNVQLFKIVAFAITGFLAGFGGILNFAFLNNVQGTMGIGLELDVIAATIIGGTSLKGGEGTILGTVIGVLILGILRNGLVLLGISPYLQMVFIGVVIIAAVAVDMWTRR